MTREEEIEKEANRVSYNGEQYTSFIQGAEWADKTMIDKICKLLKDSEYSDCDGVISKFNEDYIENVIRKTLEE